MSPDESKTHIPEQASWLPYPIPGNIVSVRNWIANRVDALYDGAYVGFHNEPVLYALYDEKEEMLEFRTHTPKRGKMVAMNPGASRVSKLLPLQIEGNSLAVSRGAGYEKLNHVEAENAKLIREISYAEIFRYLGFDERATRAIQMLGAASGILGKLTGVEQPQSAYQVTKEGQKSGLLLVNEKHQPNVRPPFFGGPGTFRKRRHATSH